MSLENKNVCEIQCRGFFEFKRTNLIKLKPTYLFPSFASVATLVNISGILNSFGLLSISGFVGTSSHICSTGNKNKIETK